MRLRTLLPLAAASLAAALPARGAPEPDGAGSRGLASRVHVIDFEGAIEPALAAYAERRIDEAKAAGAQLIVFRVESPGGRVDVTKDLADKIVGLPKTVRTLAWIPEYAYSGAAIVALACDEIVMAPKAFLGDAQPGMPSAEGWKPVGEKGESPIRAWVRGWAQDNGYPVLLAEKMVSEHLEVVMARTEDGRTAFVLANEWEDDGQEVLDGFQRSALRKVRTFPKGQLLTMTAGEAKEYGFASRLVADEKALLAAVSAPGATVVQHSMTFSERAGRWLLGLAGVLAAILLLGVGFTIFQGVGLATIIAGGALVLFGLVVATAGLAHGFPFFLMAVGLVLLLVEAFLVPGFGVPGILGIVSFVAGTLFLATGIRPLEPGTFDGEAATRFGLQLVATMIVAGALLAVLVRVLPGTRLARGAMLPGGDLPAGAAVLAGTATGSATPAVAVTALRPAGRATVGGNLVDVVSEGGFVEAGTALSVVRVEGNRVVVRALAP